MLSFYTKRSTSGSQPRARQIESTTNLSQTSSNQLMWTRRLSNSTFSSKPIRSRSFRWDRTNDNAGHEQSVCGPVRELPPVECELLFQDPLELAGVDHQTSLPCFGTKEH